MTDNTTTADTTTLQPAAPRPAYRLPQPTSVDPRFTDGLFFDIAHALARNGFPRPAAPTGPTSRPPCTASSTRRTRDHRRHRPARQPARPEAVRHCGLAQTAWRWAVTRARVWLCPPRRIGQPHATRPTVDHRAVPIQPPHTPRDGPPTRSGGSARGCVRRRFRRW